MDELGFPSWTPDSLAEHLRRIGPRSEEEQRLQERYERVKRSGDADAIKLARIVVSGMEGAMWRYPTMLRLATSPVMQPVRASVTRHAELFGKSFIQRKLRPILMCYWRNEVPTT